MNDKCPFKIECRSDCKFIRGPYEWIYYDEEMQMYVGVGARYCDPSNTYMCTLTEEIVQPREDKVP